MNEILVRLATATLLLSVSAVLMQGLMLVLRPSSARVRQCAWFCVLIQGIVLFHLPVPVPWYDPPPDDRISSKTQCVQQLSAESPAATRKIEAEITEPSLAAPVVRATRPSLPRQVAPQRDWSMVVVALWASGIVVLIIFSGLSYLLFLRQLAQGQPGPFAWAEELRDLLQQRGIVRTISLLVTRSIGPALCWAPWSYRICVPGPSWAKLAPTHRRQVLRHELAHFERADLWTLVLVRLLALPHWFNPFAWWAVHQISQSAEWACDEAAAGRKPEEAVEFAKALVQLGVAHSAAVCPARAAGRSSLSIRIRRLILMNSRKDSLMKKVLILVVAASLVAINLVRIELIAKEPTPLEAAPARPDAPQAANAASQQTSQETKTRNGPLPQGMTADGRLLKEVIIVGNDTFPTSVLKKEAELKVGDAANPFAVEKGRRSIEEYYQRKGYDKVRVTILEGNKAGDTRAVYNVDEGTRRTIFWVNFVGNQFVSSARLKTIIQSHPPYSYLLSGEADRKRLDEDGAKLTAYYRSLGFFNVKVGRELEFTNKKNWLTITFTINEGPRYSVRNVTFLGNKKIENSRLAEKLKLLSGMDFDQNQQNVDLQKLRDEYGSNGYVFAKIEAENRFLEEPGKLDIVYNVEEGSRYRVGPINIEIKGESPHMQPETKPASTDGSTAEPDTDEAIAIAEIKKLGGKITRDEKSPGKPVISVDLQGTKVTDAWLANLKGLTKLKSLVLCHTAVDTGLEHLKGLTTLESLDLWNTAVTDKGLEHLKGLTQLQSLNLGVNKVTDKGLEHLKGLTQLQSLNLFGTEVTDTGLKQLKGLTQLQSLDLGVLKFTGRDGSNVLTTVVFGTRVTDAGLEQLKGLPQLQSLDLRDTQVTDTGLEQLKGLTQLKSLGLWGTLVTDIGVRKLRQTLPNCKIDPRIAGSAAAISFADGKSGDVSKSLQGTWQVVYLETNGEKFPDDKVKDLKFIFQGDLVFSPKTNGEDPKVKFRLDTSKNPHTIDVIPTEEKAPTKLATGIFALEDGKLKLCVNLYGKDTTKRPTEFKTYPGDGTGIGYVILERVKQ